MGVGRPAGAIGALPLALGVDVELGGGIRAC